MPNAQLDLLFEEARWDEAASKALCKEAVSTALQMVDLAPDLFEVCVLFCNDARIAELNAEFRDKPTPTNVLSWPDHDLAPLVAGDTPAPPPMDDPFDACLGNIAIAYETCAREADAQGKPFDTHVTHLLIHGTLHLLGYDHETDADARLMEEIEVKALAKLGLPNPY